MKPRLHQVCVLIAVAVVLLPSAAAGRLTHVYTEDFTTETYCWSDYTTALWDTAAGEVKLHPFAVARAGSSYVGGSAVDVAISGNYAFVTVGPGARAVDEFAVVDIYFPNSPVLFGGCDLPYSPYGMDISGDYVYVANDYLTSINIRNPVDPYERDTCDDVEGARDVAVSGDYAYVASGTFGFSVVDISDTLSMNGAGWCATPGFAYGVAVAGDWAFVADGDSGLTTILIETPTSPSVEGRRVTPGIAYDVAVSGNYAYVADGTNGLQVVDISWPGNPTLAGNYNTSGSAERVTVTGDLAYVADGTSGLQVIDITDPTNPTLAFSHDTPQTASGVATIGDYTYVADGDAGLIAVHTADACPPVTAGGTWGGGGGNGVAVDGNYAYLADSYLRVVDISDPSAPVHVVACDLPGYSTARDVALSGNVAYVALAGEGLASVTISDPTSPAFVDTCPTPGSAYAVAIAGDYAYVADYGAGLQVIDLSLDMSIVATCNTPGEAHDVVVSGNYAYVADHGSGLQVIDISDPTSPSVVGSYDTPGWCYGVAVEGDYAYLADNDYLRIIDITKPWSPTEIGPGCGGAFSLRRLFVAGDYAYCADYHAGLRVIDIGSPWGPWLIGTRDTPIPSFTNDVAVAGDHAYAAHSGGVDVMEVFQRDFDLTRNEAMSIDVEPWGYDVVRACLSSTHTDTVRFQLRSGGSWIWVAPDGSWYEFPVSSSVLWWRSTHTYAYAGGIVNPTCSALTITWLYRFPIIESIVDIPNDQGRQVRISWARSGHDFVGDSPTITEYAIYRRIDRARTALLDVVSESSLVDRAVVDAGSDLAPLPSSESSGSHDLGGRYPPGSWDFVTSVPACCEDDYSVVVPTLADSTISGGMEYSVFFVRALTDTPGVYWGGVPDSGYSVDNLAPAVPRSFAVDYGASENELTWEESLDEDFQYFRIYRGTDPDFTPEPGNLVHMTIDVQWTDEVSEGWQYHYKIAAVDFSGNESDAASPESMTPVDEPATPTRFALYQNVPNPHEGSTEIRYDVPRDGAEVSLAVFDVGGRLVRRLVEGSQDAGSEVAVWDGKDHRGRDVASGVYYARLRAPGYESTVKMILLR